MACHHYGGRVRRKSDIVIKEALVFFFFVCLLEDVRLGVYAYSKAVYCGLEKGKGAVLLHALVFGVRRLWYCCCFGHRWYG